MPLTYYPFTVYLYQVGREKLRHPRTIRGDGLAYSVDRLEQNIENDLKKQYGVDEVKFYFSPVDLSVLSN